MIRRIAFLFLLLVSASLSAQTDSVAVPAKKVRKIGVLPVPTIGFAPETRLYFGAVALFTLRFWQDETLAVVLLRQACYLGV